MDPFVKLDAIGQAELVRRREVTPLDLVDAAIARIEKLNPTLNAVITPLFEEARAAARSSTLPEGPFRGVPFLLKDIGVMQAGQPYYAGNRALRDARYRAPADSYLGARFRAAGLIVLGKTNTPELGAQSTTQPLAFGPTRNPWDLERSTSGSSGGSCAAVAAGLVPIAHANDGGGSIRLPAAWCGLAGLKPSRGRVAFGPTNVSRMGVELVVSRSLRDVAAMLDAVHGNEPGELFLTPPPARRYTEELGVDPGRLRIGILTHAPGLVLHSECIKGTEAAGRLLESLGHSVEPAWPEALFDTERIHQRTLGLADMRRRIRALQTLLGRPAVESDVEPYLWKLARFDLPPVAAEEYIAASEWQQGWVARVSAWWSMFDLLLSPTVCEPPATLAEMTPPADKPWKLGRRVQEQCAFTRPFNTTGQPAISLPLHWTPEGLPVGVQLVASMGREDLLLRVAAQLEVAHSWSGRRPPVSV
jgi:amidase